MLVSRIIGAYTRYRDRIYTPVSLGQDILTGERPKEEYYKDSAQFLNTGEKAILEAGDRSGGTLAFLTRGMPNILLFHLTPIFLCANKASNN